MKDSTKQLIAVESKQCRNCFKNFTHKGLCMEIGDEKLFFCNDKCSYQFRNDLLIKEKIWEMKNKK